MKFKDFSHFESVMNSIAKTNDTMVEVKDYSEYGWWGASFMTDKFGGVYTNICHLIEEGVTYNHIHSNEEKVMTDPLMLGLTVASEKAETLAHRDLDEIYRLVNDEY